MSKKEDSKKDPKLSTKKESNKTTKPVNHETQQQRKAKEKEMIDNLNHENIQKYLMKLEEETKKGEAINKVTIESIQKIAQNLENGSLLIPENSSPLPTKPPVQPKLTYQEQREKESKAKYQIMNKKIQYFYEQIRGENQRVTKKENGPPIEFKQILTKDEHERRIRELQQQKQDRQKRLQQLQQEQQRRKKEQQQKQQSNRQQQEKKAKEEKRLKIKQQMNKRKQIHDKFLEMQAKFQKQRQEISKKPTLYKEMQEKYKSQILLPYLEEKKNKLKELRDFNKKYELDAVREHEKQYTLKSLQKSRQKKNSQINWKYDPPAKTERLVKLLQQEEAEHISQLQARKRRIEDMQQRQQIFKQELKQKYKPKIDESKKKEVEGRLEQEQRKREKLNDAVGANPRQFGKQYLEIIRKLKRSQSVKVNPVRQSSLSQQSSSKKTQAKVSFSRLQNHSQEFYEDVRRKKIEDIVNSEEATMNEKYMMLKMEAEKISQKLKQKQDLLKIKGTEQDQQDAAQLMLSSIKAKMGIVNLLKKNEASSKK